MYICRQVKCLYGGSPGVSLFLHLTYTIWRMKAVGLLRIWGLGWCQCTLINIVCIWWPAMYICIGVVFLVYLFYWIDTASNILAVFGAVGCGVPSCCLLLLYKMEQYILYVLSPFLVLPMYWSLNMPTKYKVHCKQICHMRCKQNKPYCFNML